jgi:hypothetical protein
MSPIAHRIVGVLAPDPRHQGVRRCRAKLMIDGIPRNVLARAVNRGIPVARLDLIDAQGNTLCAADRPPLIGWGEAPPASAIDVPADLHCRRHRSRRRTRPSRTRKHQVHPARGPTPCATFGAYAFRP